MIIVKRTCQCVFLQHMKVPERIAKSKVKVKVLVRPCTLAISSFICWKKF